MIPRDVRYVPRMELFVPSALPTGGSFARVKSKRMVPPIPFIFARNDGSSWPLFPQLNNSEEFHMPVILWLLGVPLSVIVIAALFGAF